jgi:hypothetical protein
MKYELILGAFLLFCHCPGCVPGYIFFVQLFVFSNAIANFDMYLFSLVWGNPEHNKLITIIIKILKIFLVPEDCSVAE